jgi:hypothetical protein
MAGEGVGHCLDRHDPKLQYTFVGHNAESMKWFPHLIREAFSAVLSHRSGLDKPLLASFAPLADHGLSFAAISKLICELHALRYTRDCILQLSEFEILLKS